MGLIPSHLRKLYKTFWEELALPWLLELLGG